MKATPRLHTAICLLAALLSVPTASRSQDADSAAPVVTYDKVLEYLRMEVKEEKIIKAVQNSPTTFTLGQKQVDELKKAGASDTLIEAIQKRGQTVAAGSDYGSFVLILDCSGSMRDKAPGGTTKWEAAQQAALNLVASIPEGRKLAFIVYGHDDKRQCEAVDVLRSLSPVDAAGKEELLGRIKALLPKGHTPIALSLQKAGGELEKSQDMAKLILITDGMESCHGDPAKEAAQLLATHPSLRGGVDVVGFGLKPEESKAVAKIAEAGRGRFFDAKTAVELSESIKTLEGEVVKAEPTKDTPISDKAPSSNLEAPVPLAVGEVVKGRLADSDRVEKYHYWAIDLPPGRYKFVLDVKRADERDANVGGDLHMMKADGKLGQGIGTMNQIDVRHRSVFRIEAKQPIQGTVRYSNNYTISDYHLGVFPEDADLGGLFFVKSPPVAPLTQGKAVTTPLLDGMDLKARDAYYAIKLPAGDFKVTVEFRRADQKKDNVGGQVGLLTKDGHEQKDSLVYVNEIAPAAAKAAKLSLAEDGDFVFRVRAAYAKETAVFSVEEWKDE